jgi:hypothetical protein
VTLAHRGKALWVDLAQPRPSGILSRESGSSWIANSQLPTKADLRVTVPTSTEFSSFWQWYPGPRPLVPGHWTLSLHDPKQGTELLKTEFEVRDSAAPPSSGERKP